MWVFMDVELRQCRDVPARADRPAHDDQFLDGMHDARLFADGKRHVGQRSNGEQTDLTWFGEKAFDEVIDGVGFHDLRSRLGQGGLSHSARSVDGFARLVRHSDERKRASLCDGDVTCIRHFQHRQGIARGFGKGDISLHRGQGFEFDFRGSEREQKRQRVIHAWVGIDDDSFRGHREL